MVIFHQHGHKPTALWNAPTRIIALFLGITLIDCTKISHYGSYKVPCKGLYTKNPSASTFGRKRHWAGDGGIRYSHQQSCQRAISSFSRTRSLGYRMRRLIGMIEEFSGVIRKNLTVLTPSFDQPVHSQLDTVLHDHPDQVIHPDPSD